MVLTWNQLHQNSEAEPDRMATRNPQNDNDNNDNCVSDSPSEDGFLNRNSSGRTVINIDEKIVQVLQEWDKLLKQQQLERLHWEVLTLKNSLRRNEFSHSMTLTDNPVVVNNTVTVMNKWSTNKTLLTHSVWLRIKAKELLIYHGKNIKEHQNWTLNTRNTFLFSSDDFPQESDKVIYAMQYLAGEPKETWFQDTAQNYSTVTWNGFSKFLLNIIEDPVNWQLDVTQLYTDTVQLLNQSVHAFNSHLGTLEAQLPPVQWRSYVDPFLHQVEAWHLSGLNNVPRPAYYSK